MPQVVLRDVHRDVLAAYEVDEVLATLVARAGGDQQLLEVTRADDVTEFRGVYADAFGMRTRLAEALVVGADLAALPHLVGKVDGSAVACAQVRPGDSFAYVSGVGVRRDVQRRGYGSAMLAACCAAADRLGCSYVWLNCSPETVPFYEGIGFERVDTYVALIGS